MNSTEVSIKSRLGQSEYPIPLTGSGIYIYIFPNLCKAVFYRSPLQYLLRKTVLFHWVTKLVRCEFEASGAILPIICERACTKDGGKQSALIISFKSLDSVLAEAYVPIDFPDM